MGNYSKENLIAIPATAVPAGTLAIKIGNEVFTPGNIRISSGIDFFKCASVNTTDKTWTGYKAVLVEGIYIFDDTATAGLTYGTGYTPAVGDIYNQIATVKVSSLWNGSTLDEYTVALWDFEDGIVSRGNLQAELELTGAAIAGGAKFGDKALSLSPSPGYARVTMPEFNRSQDYTVDFWIKVQPFSGNIMVYMNNPIEGAFSPSTNDRLMAVYCTSSYMCLHGGDYGGENTMYDMPVSTLTDGNFHHIALVRTAGHMKFAMDGHFSEVEIDSACPNLNDVPIHFGWDVNNWGNHNGIVFDEIRFSSCARWTEDFTVPSEPY